MLTAGVHIVFGSNYGQINLYLLLALVEQKHQYS